MIPVGSTVFALHYRKVMKPVINAWNKVQTTSGNLSKILRKTVARLQRSS